MTIQGQVRSEWLTGTSNVLSGDFAPVASGEIINMENYGVFTSVENAGQISLRFMHRPVHFPYWFAFGLDENIATIAAQVPETEPSRAILRVSYPYVGMLNDVIAVPDVVMPQ